MNIYAVVVISLLLLLAAVGLMISHVRAWWAFRRQELDAENFDYRRRQFRRRMQTSAMLGLLAVALLAGPVLIQWVHSIWFAIGFWGLTMLLACWVVLLAVVDIWATKHHFGRLHHRCLVEQAKLQAEISRVQAGKGDGKRMRDERM